MVKTMPFFFIVPVWVMAVVGSIVLLAIERTRTAGIYLLLGSTGGLVGAFVLSTAALLVGGRLVEGTGQGWLVLVGYLGGIVVGALIGVTAGLLAALGVMRRRRRRISGRLWRS